MWPFAGKSVIQMICEIYHYLYSSYLTEFIDWLTFEYQANSSFIELGQDTIWWYVS